MLLLVTLGCAGTPSASPRTPHQDRARVQVTDQNVAATWRALKTTRRDTEHYEASRAGLLHYLLGHSQAVIASNDYSGLISHFADLTSLYSPSEIAQGHVDKGLQPVCKAIVEHGSPRADEGAVLSALFILATLEDDAELYAAYYKRLKEWGVSARTILPDPIGFENELINVWERHAYLSPAPEVLHTLAQQYIDERADFVRRFQMAEGHFPLTNRDLEHIQSTSYAIAGVYLRVGDLTQAHKHLQEASTAGNLDARMIEMLEQAMQEGVDGSNALLGLASAPGFRKQLPEVSESLCALGRRRYPKDARFAACLANLASINNDADSMIAFYEQAIDDAPESYELRDLYLVDLYNLMSLAEPDADVDRMTLIADHLTAQLEARLKKWPNNPPPVSPAKLYLALGLSEMNTGQAQDAERHLRRSLDLQADSAARLQLGNLLARTGQPTAAAEQYAAALADTPESEQVQRAELQEKLGDSQRLLGNPEEARKHYKQSLDLWEGLLKRLKGPQAGFAEVRRGILNSRLGQRSEAHKAFRTALRLAPGVAETYKGILAHLAVHDPDRELALRVFRHAQRQLQLDPEWKVYLALWLQIIHGQNPGNELQEANELLQDFSGKDAWWSKLASFGAGQTSYDALLEQAHDRGQRAEAIFYEGARLLRNGDAESARTHFREVLETQLVNFYEFIMAQELLRDSKTEPATDLKRALQSAAPEAP